MIFDIRNKTIIVTGGNSGIGLVISKSLIEYGAAVIRLDKKFNSKTFKVLKKNKSNLDIEIDLSDTKKIPKLLKNIKQNFNKIDEKIWKCYYFVYICWYFHQDMNKIISVCNHIFSIML